jgi:NO-binding membrane sensor protein with MHYT domain
MLSDFFQLLPVPADEIKGVYSTQLVFLSYIVACVASYVALDITSRMRDVGVSKLAQLWWLLGGSFAMGAGIWSMHFIGMLAFIMPMPMTYSPMITFLSMIIAVLASGIAFSLLRPKRIKLSYMIFGGIILGFSIASMHYVGMAAMLGMKIRYLPGLFLLSIIIAIVASEAALYLAIKSSQGSVKSRIRLKIVSALIMGAAICGMHYTGMAAAVFTSDHHVHSALSEVNPNMLALTVAIVTIFFLGIAVALSSFQAVLNARSVEMARRAGMAEVASNVLHNVGNVLNSVNVSSSIIKEHIKNIDLQNLVEINNLLKEHEHDLGSFISENQQGSKFPLYLSQLTEIWTTEFTLLKSELNQLDYNIEHIKNIVSMQQKLSGISNFEELVSIEDLIEESLILTSINFKRHDIDVKRAYEMLKPVYIDKSKLTQILINLIRNAKESLDESSTLDKQIIITTRTKKENFCIEICDNGIGIRLEDRTKIFSHGFTTKDTGHGFGLHASAITAQEMNGTLTVFSKGLGEGAAFKLTFPNKFKEHEHD